MPLPKEFKEFLFDAAIELEPFLKKYIRPLGAFLLLANEPDDYSEIEEIGLREVDPIHWTENPR